MHPRPSRTSRPIGVAALATLLLAVGAPLAHAGGMMLHTRGVRPTAMAGAFVAGADDLNALWFNPAGLVELPEGDRQFLLDVAYVDQGVSYTRIDSGMNPQATVNSSSPGLPIPTLGLGFRLGEHLVAAAGVYAPYSGLGRYPEDGPQRYSLVNLTETALIIFEASVAYRVSDKLRVGAGLQNMVTRMASTVVFSGCPGQTVCAPEDPEFDALGKVKMLDLFNPSGVFGVQFDATKKVHLGASFQLPFRVGGTGSFETRLPSSGFYNGATVVGNKADVSFWLPPILRIGVEVQPAKRWRAELAATTEMWKVQDKMSITPRNVRIEGAPGVGTYELGPLEIPRHYENSYSVSLGIEGQPAAALPLDVRAGAAYETSAAPPAYLSVLTVDGPKTLLAGGIGWHHGKWRADATVAVVHMSDVTVSPDVGKSPQLTPVRDDPNDPNPPKTYVNWGDYSSSWIVAGVGIQTAF